MAKFNFFFSFAILLLDLLALFGTIDHFLTLDTFFHLASRLSHLPRLPDTLLTATSPRFIFVLVLDIRILLGLRLWTSFLQPPFGLSSCLVALNLPTC